MVCCTTETACVSSAAFVPAGRGQSPGRRSERFGRCSYEINFNRHFYKFTPPRDLKGIDAEIELAEKGGMRLFREVVAK